MADSGRLSVGIAVDYLQANRCRSVLPAACQWRHAYTLLVHTLGFEDQSLDVHGPHYALIDLGSHATDQSAAFFFSLTLEA